VRREARASNTTNLLPPFQTRASTCLNPSVAACALSRVSHTDRLFCGRSASVAAPNRSRVPGGFERTRRLLRLLSALRLDGAGDAVVAVGLRAVLPQEGRDVGRDRVRHRQSLQPNRRSRYNHTMKMESSDVFDSLEGQLRTTDEMDLVVL